MQTQTQTGTEVTLEGIEYCGRPAVRATFALAGKGPVSVLVDSYGSPSKHPNVRGAIGWNGNQQVCLTIPEAAYQQALAEARAIGERELADLREGRTPITVHYHDGEYLSGYMVFGRAGDLLQELGLARDVDGWGTHVGSTCVKALGETFTYAQAAEFARPALEAARAKEDAAEAARRDKFAEAARTGRPVLLAQWSDECDDPSEECDLDDVREYALPDGSTRVERNHTW